MELQPLVSYLRITRQCIPRMVHIALELAVLGVLYGTMEETQCIGDQHHTWLDKAEEISLCRLFTIALQLIH